MCEFWVAAMWAAVTWVDASRVPDHETPNNVWCRRKGYEKRKAAILIDQFQVVTSLSSYYHTPICEVFITERLWNQV